jgi:MFS family permease
MTLSLISIPCLVIIPITVLVGKLMYVVAKKTLAIVGILLFMVGGILPAFMESFTVILIMRGLLGCGIGFMQVLCSALVAENFEGAERDKVQGEMTSAQMLGCMVMVFVGGWLGSISWSATFFVHLFGIISLIGVILFIPYKKPVQTDGTQPKEKHQLTGAMWGWCILMFVFFIGGQTFANTLPFHVAEMNIGSSTESGLSLAFFAVGGFLMGLFFGKVAGMAKKATLAVGLFLLAASYFVIAYSGSMTMIYLGSFLCGMAFSIAMPCIIVGAANSVVAHTAGMAVALATCFQNFSMFLNPYIVNPVATSLSQTVGTNLNQMAFLWTSCMIILLGIFSLVQGFLSKRKTTA